MHHYSAMSSSPICRKSWQNWAFASIFLHRYRPFFRPFPWTSNLVAVEGFWQTVAYFLPSLRHRFLFGLGWNSKRYRLEGCVWISASNTLRKPCIGRVLHWENRESLLKEKMKLRCNGKTMLNYLLMFNDYLMRNQNIHIIIQCVSAKLNVDNQ